MAEAEVEAQVSSPRADDETAAADMESQIKSAMRSRASHFKDQSDSLTFEGVRRLLEKDLGLETYALDVHKKFIKQCLSESLDQDGDDNGSKGSLETEEKNNPTKKEKMEDSAEIEQPKKGAKEASFEDGEEMDDSPVMGLLTGQQKKAKAQTKDSEDIVKENFPTERTVKDAVWKRASYLKANSSTITMAGVRKLLEEDLELEKNTLLPFKKFISEQIDLVLNPPRVLKPATKKSSEKSSRGKPAKHESSEENDDSLESESEEEDAKTKKKVATKRKISDEPKKRKVPPTGTKSSSKKRSKAAEENTDAEAGGASEDDRSQSSDENMKKEVATLSYGKRVERLKSVIKSCGMSVPPVIYKKAKQVPEDKREAFLRKELEEILSREGLSADPSEKEIKDVKKRKDRAKELEGIDMSNIVSSTRRRSAASFFVPPPKLKITVEKKDYGTENSSDEECDSEDESDEGDDSQSEEEVIEDADEDNSD